MENSVQSLAPSTQDTVEVSRECRPMSRQPLFKGLFLKKIIKELYDLVLELEKVEKLETSVR